jgi:hypothetical protein
MAPGMQKVLPVITRTYDASALNLIANHPDVRPYLGHPESPEPLDLTPLVANPANITLEADGGGWLLQALLPGVYELHTLFLAEARGKSYFRQAKEALRYVFTATDALEILTKCPDDNPGAHMAASLVGFREREHREAVWNVGTAAECGVSFQALTIDDWLRRDPVIIQVTEDFWKSLCAAYPEPYLSPPLPDLAHARLMGAALMMIRAGQASKAVGIFNRTAIFLGLRGIVALRDDVFDIGGALVLVKPEGFGVLLTG